MALVKTPFMLACKGCTYNANNQCLVTAAGRNSFFVVQNDEWVLKRGEGGLTVDAATAALLIDPGATPTTGDSFKIGVTEYSLTENANGEPFAVEAG